ncbi:MAG: DUF899 family protein [Pirellulales bacterium]
MSSDHKIVSRKDWLVERTRLLHEEKAFTRKKDELAQRRRDLPWVEVQENYVFEGPNGPTTLADLFDGRGQLLIYHFMFAPEWTQGCKSCSLVADHFDPSVVHLRHRDVSLAAVSRADRQTAGLSHADGLEFPLGLVGRQHVQSRLRRLFHRTGTAKPTHDLQLRIAAVPDHRSARLERVHPRRRGQNLSHLFDVLRAA